MKKNSDKWIKFEGDKWSVKATTIGMPGRDIAITVNLNLKLSQPQVEDKKKEIERLVEEWFLDSKLLEPFHFIYDVTTPYYSHSRERNMVFVINISVLSRKTIELGSGAFSFDILFRGEIERLVEELGLGEKV